MLTSQGINATPFIDALIRYGATQETAEGIAESVTQIASHKTPNYPVRTSVALGAVGYEIQADLQAGMLVLVSAAPIVQPE